MLKKYFPRFYSAEILSVQNRCAAHLLHSFGSSSHEYFPDMGWTCKCNLPHLDRIPLQNITQQCSVSDTPEEIYSALQTWNTKIRTGTTKPSSGSPNNRNRREGTVLKNTSNSGLSYHRPTQQNMDTHLVAFHQCSTDLDSIAHHHIHHSLS